MENFTPAGSSINSRWWERSAGCRLPSSSCPSSAGLFPNAPSASPGQAMPANLQPDLRRLSSVIAADGSGKTAPALSEKCPRCSLKVPAPSSVEELLRRLAVKLQLRLSDLGRFPCLCCPQKVL